MLHVRHMNSAQLHNDIINCCMAAWLLSVSLFTKQNGHPQPASDRPKSSSFRYGRHSYICIPFVKIFSKSDHFSYFGIYQVDIALSGQRFQMSVLTYLLVDSTVQSDHPSHLIFLCISRFGHLQF